MFHRAFVHAMLIDYAEGRDGSSWNRERRLADRLIETTSQFDGLFEPTADEADAVQRPPRPPGGGIGGLLAGLSQAVEWRLPAR